MCYNFNTKGDFYIVVCSAVKIKLKSTDKEVVVGGHLLMSNKSNIHKKYTKEDKFGRKYYCKRSRLRQLRREKREQRRDFRRVKINEDRDDLDI